MPCTALLLSFLAYADVVGPPTRDCPNGSIGSRGHGGSHCMPLSCAQTPCSAGTCETTGLCVLEEERSCAGRRTEPGCTRVHREAFGPCRTDADCRSGTCVIDAYCLDAEAPEAPEELEAPEAPEAPDPLPGSSGCLCSGGTGASMVFLLGLLPLTRARRRQR